VTPLLDGVTRLRVWQASPDRWRVDQLSDAGEDDIYQAGSNSYTWHSGAELFTEIIGTPAIRLPQDSDLVPSTLAERLISWAGPGAKLSTLAPQRVAGQGAAGLQIVPASADSTVARVAIWASPASGLPLRVDVFDRSSATPALESQFLQVGLGMPAASVLTPAVGSPGTGFTTTTPQAFAGVLNNLATVRLPSHLAGLTQTRSPVPRIHIYGTGLTAFAVLTFTPATGGQLLSTALDDGAAQLTFKDIDGDGTTAGVGAVASAPLINLIVLKSDRGPDTFLLVGLVSKTTLEQAATTLASRPGRSR